MVKSTLVATLYVDPVVGNDANTGSESDPYKTLTHALRGSTTAKIIRMACGIYTTASGEVFPLVIPPGVMLVGDEATKGQGMVISGSGQYHSHSFGVQNMTLLLLGDAQLMGVTVTNNTAKGTGVWIESASPILANNTFINCSREGVFVSGTAQPMIVDNIFVQNAVAGLVIACQSKGELLGNVWYKNILGIAISDFASPMVANNRLSENCTAIALSRDARPILRHNIIEKNTQGGLLINGNAIPDLGSSQESGGNIFRDNHYFDVKNATIRKVVLSGNSLKMTQVKGLVDLTSVIEDTPSLISVSSFTDLMGHWAEPFITVLAKMNLTRGFADGSYKPDKPVTRAQYAALVVSAFNNSPKRPAPDFIDVAKDYWAYGAIKIAAQTGFVGGKGDGTFGPEQNVLRLQVLVSLVNGLALPAAHPDTVLSYSDCHTIPDSARKAVATATQHGIVVNYPDPHKIEPHREATRGEVAAMVHQALVATGRISVISSPYIVFPLTRKI